MGIFDRIVRYIERGTEPDETQSWNDGTGEIWEVKIYTGNSANIIDNNINEMSGKINRLERTNKQ